MVTDAKSELPLAVIATPANDNVRDRTTTKGGALINEMNPKIHSEEHDRYE